MLPYPRCLEQENKRHRDAEVQCDAPTTAGRSLFSDGAAQAARAGRERVLQATQDETYTLLHGPTL